MFSMVGQHCRDALISLPTSEAIHRFGFGLPELPRPARIFGKETAPQRRDGRRELQKPFPLCPRPVSAVYFGCRTTIIQETADFADGRGY